MIPRTFIPGSDYVYFKIYSGTKSADEILSRVVGPLTTMLIDAGAISKYFFIRYSDPASHLRFRMLLSDRSQYGVVFSHFYQMMQPYVDNGIVNRVMCDTYEREIERYGASTMDLSEELFHVDSVSVIHILQAIEELDAYRREDVRWQLSVKLLEDYLTAFDYEQQDRQRIYTRMSDGYKREFGFTSHTMTKQLNDKYRKEESAIRQMLEDEEYLAEYRSLLGTRFENMTAVARNIRDEVLSSETQERLDHLLCSYLHMTMNRLFKSQNRLHEMVVYEFLNKYIRSAIARQQMNKLQNENRAYEGAR